MLEHGRHRQGNVGAKGAREVKPQYDPKKVKSNLTLLYEKVNIYIYRYSWVASLYLLTLVI